MPKKARIIAYYLPQFHQIPENDDWWGEGFTEWTNVKKAKPLFRGHDQPKIPGELGYYNLLDSEVRERQARMALEYGIDGFCYWHYWFGNSKQLLEKPFQEVLSSKKPIFGFCLSWVNTDWGGLPYGDLNNRLLMKQEYPGREDYINHFNYVLDAFKDERYLRIDDKPIFVVYNPKGLPNAKEFIDLWNNLATLNGLKGIYFIAYAHFDYDYKANGFQALTPPSPSHLFMRVKYSLLDRLVHRISGFRLNSLLKGVPQIRNLYSHKRLVRASNYGDIPKSINFFPSLSPNWDHSPRSGTKASIIINNKPKLFGQNLRNCYDRIKHNSKDEKIIFIKAWNEWGEGNYLEPDAKTGYQYLEEIKKFLSST